MLVNKKYTVIRKAIAYCQSSRKRYTSLFEMIVGVLRTATSFSRYNPTWFLGMGKWVQVFCQ